MNIIPPRKICFSGGGIRAVAFVGALEVLQKRGLLTHVDEYIGISAGALIGFLLAIGYTLPELRKLVLEFDFSLVRNLDPEQSLSFLDTFGVDDGSNLTKLFESVMRQKGLASTITFQELSQIRPPLPAFRCFATNLNTCLPREFSLKVTPTVKIIDAMRASMSLPFYFMPVEDPITGHFLTDGGVMNNYPMVFLSEEEQRHSLGLMFSAEHAENKEIETLFDFVMQMMACIYMPRIRTIKKMLAERTILLPRGEFPPWNFEATKEERADLLASAAAATEKFLQAGTRKKPFRRFSVS
jgi:NTE family protein